MLKAGIIEGDLTRIVPPVVYLSLTVLAGALDKGLEKPDGDTFLDKALDALRHPDSKTGAFSMAAWAPMVALGVVGAIESGGKDVLNMMQSGQVDLGNIGRIAGATLGAYAFSASFQSAMTGGVESKDGGTVEKPEKTLDENLEENSRAMEKLKKGFVTGKVKDAVQMIEPVTKIFGDNPSQQASGSMLVVSFAMSAVMSTAGYYVNKYTIEKGKESLLEQQKTTKSHAAAPVMAQETPIAAREAAKNSEYYRGK